MEALRAVWEEDKVFRKNEISSVAVEPPANQLFCPRPGIHAGSEDTSPLFAAGGAVLWQVASRHKRPSPKAVFVSQRFVQAAVGRARQDRGTLPGGFVSAVLFF